MEVIKNNNFLESINSIKTSLIAAINRNLQLFNMNLK